MPSSLITGIAGLRPDPARAALVTAPPYDVIKKGSRLEALLAARQDSMYHVTLGPDPVAALAGLRQRGALVADDEACLYVTEQCWDGQRRLGVYAAVAARPYESGFVRRHEKTFDDKVQGRIALTRATALTIGPVFLLTRQALDAQLEAAIAGAQPCSAFTTDLQDLNDLHGIAWRVWRLPIAEPAAQAILTVLGEHPLYIADGHHRYHAALLNRQSHALCYITSGAQIQAYNRVIRGTVPFASIRDQLALQPAEAFTTPPAGQFRIYHGGKAWTLAARERPNHVVAGLDCSILERELYPLLGLRHEMIMDPQHFDYYPERDLATMCEVVDAGSYDLAVALHPVAVDQLMAVADAGLQDQSIVMPEKSTFFAPKILTGIVLYRHSPA